MDEMHLGKNKYISTKRAAKITGYAQDYVGQLVRTGKVKATKVGRSWFVLEEDALKLSGKPAALKSPERALAELDNRRSGVKQESSITFSVEYPKTWSQVQYFQEDKPLLPISDNRESHINKHSIEILDEHRVKISAAQSASRFFGDARQKTPETYSFDLSAERAVATVKAQSFDGVRYEAQSTNSNAALHYPSGSGTQPSEITRVAETDSGDQELIMIGSTTSGGASGFDAHWLVRVFVSALIVSFFALLIPIL